jgi:hypothetical protein
MDRPRGALVSRPDPTSPDRDASPDGEGRAAAEGGGDAPEGRLTRLALLLPVICAPLGLALAIFASFMIAGWHVTHSAMVQVETRWRPDETLALRVHVHDAENAGIPGASVRVGLRRGEQSLALGELRDVSGSGATQGTVHAPAWPPGPAELVLEIRGGAHEFREVVPIELVAAREAKRGELTISTSVKNWTDDTEPQPEHLRIALRPLGRLAAGFENTLLVRVTDLEGRPHVGPVEVHLLDGEFAAARGTRDAPVRIVRDSTDASGLLRFDGQLSTDVLRLEVRVPVPAPVPAAMSDAPVAAPCGKCGAGDTAVGRATRAAQAEAIERAKAVAAGTATEAGGTATATGAAGTATATGAGGTAAGAAVPATEPGAVPGAVPATAAGAGGTATEPGAVPATEPGAVPATEPAPAWLGTRKFRLVSFAGAVRVTAEPLAVAPGGTLEIKARGLRAKRAVFVDVHGPDGAWIDTLEPVLGPEPPRGWSVGALSPGFLQIEAYQFTTSPGESTALARVQITAGAPDTDAALTPLFVQQRALLELGRVEKGFDRELERKYLDALERAEVAPVDVPLARAWLMGTLPVEVLGPPVALTTLARDQAELRARKQRWVTGLRWFILGGGGVFLLLTLLLIVLSHRQAAGRLTREIHGKDATATIAREIREAQRAVLLRAVAMMVTMGLGLVLTVIVLDKLLWRL